MSDELEDVVPIEVWEEFKAKWEDATEEQRQVLMADAQKWHLGRFDVLHVRAKD